MLKVIGRLIREDDGQGMVEYGLIIALIAIVVIAALTAVGEQIEDVFDYIKDKITTPAASGSST